MDELIRFVPGGIQWYAKDGSHGECSWLSDAIKHVEAGRLKVFVGGDVIPFDGEISEHRDGR